MKLLLSVEQIPPIVLHFLLIGVSAIAWFVMCLILLFAILSSKKLNSIIFDPKLKFEAGFNFSIGFFKSFVKISKEEEMHKKDKPKKK